ncbi:MAG: hypothetical protein ACRDRW_16580 [Pseudonocardiaceae bacterium]
MYHLFTPTLGPEAFMAVFFIDYDPIIKVADDYWFSKVVCNERTGVLEFPHDDRAARKSFGPAATDPARPHTIPLHPDVGARRDPPTGEKIWGTYGWISRC